MTILCVFVLTCNGNSMCTDGVIRTLGQGHITVCLVFFVHSLFSEVSFL